MMNDAYPGKHCSLWAYWGACKFSQNPEAACMNNWMEKYCQKSCKILECSSPENRISDMFDEHPEPIDPDFPGFEDLAITSGTLIIKIIHCNFHNH